MLTSIRKSKVITLISGLMLVCITLSFPGVILGSTETRSVQDLARKKAVENSVGQKSTTETEGVHSNTQKEVPIWVNHTTRTKDTLNRAQPIESGYSQPQRSVVSYSQQPAPLNRQNENDINLLARVIHAEARGEPFEGKVAVAAVLLNRLHDSRFPKTLSGIIFKQGEFCTVRDGQIWMTPNKQAIQAARLAMAGWDPSGGAVYFYNPAKTTSGWMWTRPVVNKIGNHFFAV